MNAPARLSLYPRTVLAALFVVACLSPAFADREPLISEISGIPWTPPDPEAAPKVVYGNDDRIDVFEETDPARIAYAASVAALISVNDLTNNGDGTFTIDVSAYTIAGLPPCPEEPFGDQPVAAFCSSFLVGPDIMVTAGHCYSASTLTSGRFVFGFDMLNASSPVLVVDESQVYRGASIIARQNSGDFDYTVVRLDREVIAPGAQPLPIRREGVVPVGTPIGVIGHPAGLPKKIAFGSATQVFDNSFSEFFVANLDTYGGNSGSPIFNADTGVVEGVLVRGEPDYDFLSGCFVSNELPDDLNSFSCSDGICGEECTKTTLFAQFIPEFNPPQGTIEFDQAQYTCSDAVGVTVRDGDLRGFQTIGVVIRAASGDEEALILAETNLGSGEFFGSIVTDELLKSAQDGTLDVVDGDVITATYNDSDDGTGAPAVVTAAAPVLCAPVVSLSISPLNFGEVLLGESALRDVAVSNAGPAFLSGEVSTAAPFSIVGAATYELASGSSTTVQFEFTPDTRGEAAGTASFTGGDGAVLPLTGEGVIPPDLDVTPAMHDFDQVLVGNEGVVTLTLTNVGDGFVNGSATAGAPFAVRPDGTYEIGANQSLDVTAVFAPAAEGLASGAIGFSGGGGAEVDVAGEGIGTPNIETTPTTQQFGTVFTGTAVSAEILVRNIGTGTFSGEASISAPFTLGVPASYTIAPGSFATISVRFAPTVPGTFAGELTLTGGGGAVVPVSASAISPADLTFFPTSVDFGETLIGVGSERILRITNHSALDFTGTASIDEPFAIDGDASFTIAPGATHALNVSFTPATAGPAQRGLMLAGDVLQSVMISGIGIEPPDTPKITPSVSVVEFGTVEVGQAGHQLVTLRNDGPVVVSTTAQTAAPFTVDSEPNLDIAPGASVVVTVSFAPETAEVFEGALTLAGIAGFAIVLNGEGEIVVTPPPMGCAATASKQPAGWDGAVVFAAIALLALRRKRRHFSPA